MRKSIRSANSSTNTIRRSSKLKLSPNARLVLSAAALTGGAFIPSHYAHAANATWNSAGAASNLWNAGNWVTVAGTGYTIVPGDSLFFVGNTTVTALSNNFA